MFSNPSVFLNYPPSIPFDVFVCIWYGYTVTVNMYNYAVALARFIRLRGSPQVALPNGER